MDGSLNMHRSSPRFLFLSHSGHYFCSARRRRLESRHVALRQRSPPGKRRPDVAQDSPDEPARGQKESVATGASPVRGRDDE